MKRLLTPLLNLFRSRDIRDLAVRLIILIALTILVIIIMVEFVYPESQKKKVDANEKMSIFHDGSTGTMALYELLQSLNLPVYKHMEPLYSFRVADEITAGFNDDDNIQHSRKNKKNESEEVTDSLLLIIEPEATFTEKNLVTMEEIAARDNVIILLTSHESRISGLIDQSADPQGGLLKKLLRGDRENSHYFHDVSGDNTSITYDHNSIWEDVKSVSFPAGKRFNYFEDEWNVIGRDNQGIFAIEKSIKNGAIVIISDAGFLSNYHLGDTDNALFTYRLITHYLKRDGAIYIDEFHHGFHKKWTLLYFIADRQSSVFILHILLYLILLLFMANVRFGQYRHMKKNKSNRIYYYSEGMAGLLARKEYTHDLYLLMISIIEKLRLIDKHAFSARTERLFERITTRYNNGKHTGRQIRAVYKLIRKKQKQESRL